MSEQADIVRALAEGAEPDDALAADVMTRTVLSTSLDEPILSVAELMADAHIRHAVLVDDGGDVVGIVSMRDVLRPLLDEAFALPAQLIDPAPERSRSQQTSWRRRFGGDRRR